jgi:hypothetical protein
MSADTEIIGGDYTAEEVMEMSLFGASTAPARTPERFQTPINVEEHIGSVGSTAGV